MPAKINLNNVQLYIAFTIFAALLLYIGYGMERTESNTLMLCYSGAFLMYVFIYKSTNTTAQLIALLLFAIILRFLFLIAYPGLSDDFYRFIWDGKMWHWGFHPFSFTPRDFMEMYPQFADAALFEKLNSSEYYSVYPPIHQFLFYVGTLIYPNDVFGPMIFMRLCMVIAEMVTIYYCYQLLEMYKLPLKNVLLYALNPLVILEVVGNLHFEGLMICFIISAFYFGKLKKAAHTGANLASAIATKLNPAILFIVIVRTYKSNKKLLIFTISFIVFTVIYFGPLLSNFFVTGMVESLALYFQKFEFNASIYYVINGIFSAIIGYNFIAYTGVFMLIVMIALLLWYSFTADREVELPIHALALYSIYLMCSLTIHPWYILPLIAFSVLTKYRFPVLWSFLIFFTYMGYQQGDFQEQWWVVAIEYLAVYIFAILEYFNKTQSLKRQFVLSGTKPKRSKL